MGGNFVFGLLLLSVALIGAQEYVVWEEPETDIWDEYSQPIPNPNEQLLELCKNYHLTINNKQIDCSNIDIKAKHVIHKREVDDVELEGSGNGESGKPEISLFNENNEESQVEAALEIPASVANQEHVQENSEIPAVAESDKAEVPVELSAAKVEDAAKSEPNSVPEEAAAKPSELESAVVEPPVAESDDAQEKSAVADQSSDDAQGESAAAKSVPEVDAAVVAESDHAQEESAVKPQAAEVVAEKSAVVEPTDNAQGESAVDTPVAKTDQDVSAAVEPPVAELENAQGESAVNSPVPKSASAVEPPVAESDHAQEESAVKPQAAEVVPEKSAVVEPTDNAQGESAVGTPVVKIDPEVSAAVEPPVAESENAQGESAVDPPLAKSATEVSAAVATPVAESDDARGESAVDPSVAKSAVEESAAVVPPPEVESDKARGESVVDVVGESAAVVPPSEVESDKAAEAENVQEESAVKPSEAKNGQAESALDNVPDEPAAVGPSQAVNVPEVVKPEAELEKLPAVDVTGQISDAKETEESKVLPSDLAEVEVALRQPEVVDEQQSGNAILFKEPKTVGAGSPVEGSDSDKHLASLATNEDTKNQSVEQPSTGESAKTVSKAGKDTTILIVLFVVVLVIGGAAFTHHMIKMRKAKRAETSSVVDGIRKSLQNLAGNGKAPTPDVEQGTEMKPLMNVNSSSSPVMVKEYSDKKKDGEA